MAGSEAGQKQGGDIGWMLSGELQRRIGDDNGWREKLRGRRGKGG